MPIIGITSSVNETQYPINKEYVKAISQNGGAPVILPCDGEKNAAAYLDAIDGLLLSGGGDIDAKYFGEAPAPEIIGVSEERDSFEFALIKAAIDRDMPVLGICRGMQVMNVALGGGMIQHVENHNIRDKRDAYVHEILVEKGTMLYEILGQERISVNSLHHQVLGGLGKGVEVTAKSTDGLIEAIEVAGHSFVLGVQWHPEELFSKHGEHNHIFQAFLKNCRLR